MSVRAPPGQTMLATAPLLTKVIDPVTEVSVTFRDFSNAGEGLKTNLIMPETWPFIGKGLRMCAVIRPIETKGITMGRGHLIDRHGNF